MTEPGHHTGRGGLKGLIFLGLLLVAPGLWADCTVSAQSVIFGNYDVFSVQPLDGAGNIGINCSPGASYTLGLSTGSGSYSQRKLANGAQILYYNLYTSPSRSVVWGDGTGGTGTVSGSGESANHTVYGRIPAGQNLPVGSYADTIIVTVTF
jgi:spore coat protein U-like protein